jgi:hypothetical protein
MIFDLTEEVKTGAENTRDRVKHVPFYVMLRLLATKIIYPNHFRAQNISQAKREKMEISYTMNKFSTRDHINEC